MPHMFEQDSSAATTNIGTSYDELRILVDGGHKWQLANQRRTRLPVNTALLYCTTNVTCCECATPPSVAVTVTMKLPRPVGCRSCTVPLPDLLESAWDAALMLIVGGLGTLDGAL